MTIVSKGSLKASMNAQTLKVCKFIWGATPFFAVRKIFLDLFYKLIRGKRIICTVEGMKYELDLSEMIDVCILLEKFEREVVGAIKIFCHPGWHIVDVGANVGGHTTRMAKIAGPEGKVYAFEPTDYAYQKLVRNITLNETTNVHHYQLALWNENKKDQVINFRSSWQTDGTSVSGSTTVSFIRLDDWCHEHGIKRIDMIKIDVDGHEFNVFEGGRQVLATHKPLIIMEVGAWHFADPGTDVLALLESLGYRFWEMRSMREFESREEIKKLLPEEDHAMNFSINILAATEAPKATPSFSLEHR